MLGPVLIQRFHLYALRALLVLGVASLFTGCANMTPQQCLYTDWREEGYQLATAGRPVTDYVVLNNDCNLHGIHINRRAFLEGWSAGRDDYLASLDRA